MIVDLIAALDGTRPTAEGERWPSNRNASDGDNRIFRFDFAANQLIRLRNTDGLRDAGQIFKFCRVDSTGIPGNANRGPLRARNNVRPETERFDLAAHSVYVGGRSLRSHYNEHLLLS